MFAVGECRCLAQKQLGMASGLFYLGDKMACNFVIEDMLEFCKEGCPIRVPAMSMNLPSAMLMTLPSSDLAMSM